MFKTYEVSYLNIICRICGYVIKVNLVPIFIICYTTLVFYTTSRYIVYQCTQLVNITNIKQGTSICSD